MPTIYVMRGLPASGKTTKARQMFEDFDTKRVSKDDLRAMLHAGKYTPELERFILTIRDALIGLVVSQGFDVVVDDTNLNPVHVESLWALAGTLGVNIYIIDTETPVDECVRRDALREKPIGEAVIRSMYERYLKED